MSKENTTSNISEDILNTYLKCRMISICRDLDIEYIAEYDKYTLETTKTKTKAKKKTHEKGKCKCKARVKNGGWGRQCSRNALNDTDFCGAHNKKTSNGVYSWEFFGRIDEKAPKMFVDWYQKKGVVIKNDTHFYAENNPKCLSVEQKKVFDLCL